MGDFGDFADTGWMAAAGLLFPVGQQGVWVAAEGLYGRFAHSDVDGDATNLYGGSGLLGYTFTSGGRLAPYVFASAGMLVHDYDPEDTAFDVDSESNFSYGVGGGFDYALSERIGFWFAAQYLAADETKLIPLIVGLSLRPGTN
jgi:opacity protein-like surface antigen